jgi:hypothetical protein
MSAGFAAIRDRQIPELLQDSRKNGKGGCLIE